MAETYHPQSQPQSQPISSNPSNSRTTKFRSNFFRAFFAGMFVIAFVAIIIYIIEWRIFHPHLPEFRLDSLQLTDFSLTSESLSAIWVVAFLIRNPNNKVTVSFENTESSIHYKSTLLSQTRLRQFIVGKMNQTTVISRFAANSTFERWVLNDINGDLARGCIINFNVNVVARVGFRSSWWRSRTRLNRILCSDMAVGISSTGYGGSASGMLVGGSRKCLISEGIFR